MEGRAAGWNKNRRSQDLSRGEKQGEKIHRNLDFIPFFHDFLMNLKYFGSGAKLGRRSSRTKLDGGSAFPDCRKTFQEGNKWIKFPQILPGRTFLCSLPLSSLPFSRFQPGKQNPRSGISNSRGIRVGFPHPTTL